MSVFRELPGAAAESSFAANDAVSIDMYGFFGTHSLRFPGGNLKTDAGNVAEAGVHVPINTASYSTRLEPSSAQVRRYPRK